MSTPEALAITWHGHATALIELDGIRFLTDPALTPRLAHLRRHRPVDLAAVGAPDVVLISHLHMDHLHVPSLRLLGRDIELIVPMGAASMLRRRGFRNVRETQAGRAIDVGPVTIETVRAVHPSGRGPHSRIEATPVGYVLRSPGGAVYFPGDTDLFAEMTELAGVDVALLPIWGWGRTLGAGHLDPERAVQATERLQPRVVIPIHWGTYCPIGLPSREPRWLHRPAARFASQLDAAGYGDRVRVLAPGGSVELPSRSVDVPGSTAGRE